MSQLLSETFSERTDRGATLPKSLRRMYCLLPMWQTLGEQVSYCFAGSWQQPRKKAETRKVRRGDERASRTVRCCSAV